MSDHRRGGARSRLTRYRSEGRYGQVLDPGEESVG
jgi:hypothetical protein